MSNGNPYSPFGGAQNGDVQTFAQALAEFTADLNGKYVQDALRAMANRTTAYSGSQCTEEGFAAKAGMPLVAVLPRDGASVHSMVNDGELGGMYNGKLSGATGAVVAVANGLPGAKTRAELTARIVPMGVANGNAKLGRDGHTELSVQIHGLRRIQNTGPSTLPAGCRVAISAPDPQNPLMPGVETHAGGLPFWTVPMTPAEFGLTHAAWVRAKLAPSPSTSTPPKEETYTEAERWIQILRSFALTCFAAGCAAGTEAGLTGDFIKDLGRLGVTDHKGESVSTEAATGAGQIVLTGLFGTGRDAWKTTLKGNDKVAEYVRDMPSVLLAGLHQAHDQWNSKVFGTAIRDILPGKWEDIMVHR